MKDLKPFPAFINLEEENPISYQTKDGKTKYNNLSVPVIAKMILNKKLVGKILYKDFAILDQEKAFDARSGLYRIYNEELGIFQNADNFLKKIVYDFFNNDETKEIVNCCQFFKNKSTYLAIETILIPSIKYEINEVLKRNGNHWNASFEKGFLSISFKNGTLILNTKDKTCKFFEEHSYKYYSYNYFNTEYTNFIKEKKKNRLFDFLNFKLELENIRTGETESLKKEICEERKKFLKALVFDWFFTENQSHHIICFVGQDSSGKSSFMEHIKTFSNFSDWGDVLSLDKLVDKFTSPSWFYSNNLFCNETNEKYFKENSTFKLLVAKETMAVEEKNMMPVFLKPFCKIICLGENTLNIKNDGGVDKRIMNFTFTTKKFEFSDAERWEYKDYLKIINEEDKTHGDALLQYLQNEKYEDFTQILIQGFEHFCEYNYSDNKRSFKNRYEQIFEDKLEEFAEQQNPYLTGYRTFYNPSRLSYIKISGLTQQVNNLGISVISKKDTQREQLRFLKEKIREFEDIKIITIKSDFKITIEEKIVDKNGVEEIKYKDDNLIKNNVYVFGINLKEKRDILDLLLQNRVLNGNNTGEKYNNLKVAFKTLTEESYLKVLEKFSEN